MADETPNEAVTEQVDQSVEPAAAGETHAPSSNEERPKAARRKARTAAVGTADEAVTEGPNTAGEGKESPSAGPDGEPSHEGDESTGTVTVHLSTELRRRLRRRADREGVTPDELALELLSAAIRRPVAESLPDIIARVEKLERSVAELGGTHRTEPAPPRRFEDRPRSESSGRGFAERPAGEERPQFALRSSYQGPRRFEERPRFGDQSAPGFGRGGERPRGDFGERPRGDFGERPRGDYAERGPSRGFERRDDRESSRERAPRRWESPRRGE